MLHWPLLRYAESVRHSELLQSELSLLLVLLKHGPHNQRVYVTGEKGLARILPRTDRVSVPIVSKRLYPHSRGHPQTLSALRMCVMGHKI